MTLSAHFLYKIIILFSPVCFGGVAHMVIVKRNLFPRLNIPISPRWLGQNKTYRGLICVPLLTAVGAVATRSLAGHSVPQDLRLQWPFVGHGLIVGFLYILGEIPNSYLKRRLKVYPGQLPSGVTYWGFRFLDTFDSFLPITLYYGWIFRFTVGQNCIALALFIVFAECVKKGLVICRLK